ncbi:mucin-12 [Scophthalmus maximus]|uniref:mucin-12 n=1 Tax=Scophthalmus maximus TaxID=52904 RepID=UPI001FA90CE2|nr:mucin-12 [Scophthalmus maximus]
MGRRAADLTTPVPVLGVPALVGVRGLKTTGGDRTGGALLQTWGLHCSVGVQTSPGIGRPPTQHSVQLTDTLFTPSDRITQTSKSFITKETEYKEILLITKSDKEKRAILKLKRGESKTKKEVTFKALGGEASKDVACSQRSSSGTYCYARAIKTNPHFAGNATNVRPNLKSTARYVNGSIVDSEAIGGISVDGEEAEPMKSATSRGRDPTRTQGHYAAQSGKTPQLPAAQTFGKPQKICSLCGGRQSQITGAANLGEKSPAADACPLKSALTALSTTTQTPNIERNGDLKPTQHRIPDSSTDRDNRTHFTANPQMLFLNKELRYRNTQHPACPVHSRENMLTLSHTQAAAGATSTQPTTILQKTITITKATIEMRQDDASLKSLAKQTKDGKIPRPTSLTLTPQMATATKPNNPHSHTYPKLLKVSQQNSIQYNVPQNVCVSVHATPEKTLTPPSHSYTTAAGPGNTSNTNTHKTTTTFNTALMSTKIVPDKVANTEDEITLQHSMHMTQVNVATNTTDSPQMSPEGPTLPRVQHTPASLSKWRKNPSSKVDQPTSPKFANTPHTATIVAPQCTLNGNTASDQTTHTSANHRARSVGRKILQCQPNSSNSEPTIYESTTASVKTASSATKPPHSTPRLPSSASACSTSTCNGALCKSTALRYSSVSLKNLPSAVSSLSSSENQSSVCASRATLLQATDTKQVELSRNEAPSANKPGHTTRVNNQSGVRSVFNQQHNSETTPLTLSRLLNVSENQNRASDASTHNPESKTNLNTESSTDKNRFSGYLSNESLMHEPKHENSGLSQVTNLQNYISLIKSSSSCLQGCRNTEQQSIAHYQGDANTGHEGHCAVKTAQETESNTEQFALGILDGCVNIKLKSNTDKRTPSSYSTLSVAAPHFISSSPANTRGRFDPNHSSALHQNSESDVSSHLKVHRRRELSYTTPAPFNSEGELRTHTGPECNSMLPSSAMHLVYHPHLQSCEAEALARADSKLSPAPPKPCPADSSLAHSHPVDAAMLLPPSQRCCKSAALQQKLETVEASLAANKDRITTLLKIIHDLETCHTPIIGRRCFTTGQDLKSCSTCQKTACIIYSVEYDFRQQERSFTEVLNHSARGNNASSVHLPQPLNFGLLRKVLTKSKVKSKKLCKTLFKWLPRKIQQV